MNYIILAAVYELTWFLAVQYTSVVYAQPSKVQPQPVAPAPAMKAILLQLLSCKGLYYHPLFLQYAHSYLGFSHAALSF